MKRILFMMIALLSSLIAVAITPSMLRGKTYSGIPIYEPGSQYEKFSGLVDAKVTMRFKASDKVEIKIQYFPTSTGADYFSYLTGFSKYLKPLDIKDASYRISGSDLIVNYVFGGEKGIFECTLVRDGEAIIFPDFANLGWNTILTLD